MHRMVRWIQPRARQLALSALMCFLVSEKEPRMTLHVLLRHVKTRAAAALAVAMLVVAFGAPAAHAYTTSSLRWRNNMSITYQCNRCSRTTKLVS